MIPWNPVILAGFLSLVVPSQPQNSSDIAAVVQRATEYVTRYEEELGNLIGSEEYIQNSTWYGKDVPPATIGRYANARPSEVSVSPVTGSSPW